MSEQNVNNQTAVPEPPASAPVTPPATTAVFTQADVDRIIKDRLEREENKRKDAEKKIREKADADQLAKNQEWEKLAKQREEEIDALRKENAASKLLELKRGIAAKYSIPEALINRLQGDTAETIEADAKLIAEILPKSPKIANLNPTNPAGATTGETEQQAYARIHGRSMDIFDHKFAENHGGGIVWGDKDGGGETS